MNEKRATVERIADAKTGDVVWYFNSQQNRYEDGEFKGHGVWSLCPIESETRQSFVIHGTKFDRATGIGRSRNGYSPHVYIYGNADREDRIWLGYRHRIGQDIERLKDVAVLRQIAELIGWKP